MKSDAEFIAELLMGEIYTTGWSRRWPRKISMKLVCKK